MYRGECACSDGSDRLRMRRRRRAIHRCLLSAAASSQQAQQVRARSSNRIAKLTLDLRLSQTGGEEFEGPHETLEEGERQDRLGPSHGCRDVERVYRGTSHIQAEQSLKVQVRNYGQHSPFTFLLRHRDGMRISPIVNPDLDFRL